MKCVGYSVSCVCFLCDGVGKQDGFWIQNGGEVVVYSGWVNFGQIGYIYVFVFQIVCGGDDVQLVGQWVFVLVNVIKSVVYLFVVFFCGFYIGFVEIDIEVFQIDYIVR